MSIPLHPLEEARLASLRSSGILDTPRDRRFDRLVFMAAQILKAPIAMVCFVDEDRQWFKAHVGSPVTESSRDMAFCAVTILGNGIFVCEDASIDPRFMASPYVVGPPFIRFYAGAPLLSRSGLPLGSLCVVDHKPRRLLPAQVHTLLSLTREAEELVHACEQRMELAAD